MGQTRDFIVVPAYVCYVWSCYIVRVHSIYIRAIFQIQKVFFIATLHYMYLSNPCQNQPVIILTYIDTTVDQLYYNS